VRWIGLGGGLIGAALIVSMATEDWQGALAEPRVVELAKKHRWEEALEEAEVAGQHRIAVEGYLGGLYQSVHLTHDAAVAQLDQLRDMVSRVGQSQRDPTHIRELAKDDMQNFHRYFTVCVQKGQTFLQLMPGYPNIAGFVADVWLNREELQSLSAKLGEPMATIGNTSNLAQARHWLEEEYGRDRLDADNAMRLLQFIPDRPLMDRLNLLRLPLRRGPMHPQFEQALAGLMQQPDFNAVMTEWLAQAVDAVAAKEKGRWPEPYAPESLRLAAVARKMRGEFEQAATSAEQSVHLYENVRQNLLGLVFYARKEQAGYLLLANPDQPEAAIEAARAGLAEFSGYSTREQLTKAKRQYSLYLLAAGKDAEARQMIREIGATPMPEEAVDRNVGYGLAELCQTFVNYPPQQRPQRFENWLAMSLKLAPDWPATRMVAARVALEQGQDEPAVEHLQALSKLMEDPKQFVSILQALVTQYPDRAALQQFAASYSSRQSASTRPTTGENPH
jgi:hypothetical protein